MEVDLQEPRISDGKGHMELISKALNEVDFDSRINKKHWAILQHQFFRLTCWKPVPDSAGEKEDSPFNELFMIVDVFHDHGYI